MFTDRNGNGVVDITGSASTSDILQENHYYSFGLGFEGPWLMNDGAARDNAYQYNGKELHGDFGLGLYAYGARYYDPSIGRFTGVDPIADAFPFVTTFNYAENEPIGNIDLHGLQKWSFQELANRTGVFVIGTVNAVSSNILGVGRGDPQDFGRYASAAKNGQAIGDAISVVGGVTGSIGAGIAILAEGAGGVTAVAIAPTAAAGAVSMHTAFNGAMNLVKASGGDNTLNGGKKLANEDLVAKPAERGKAPIGKDGKPVELHHRGQKQDSPLDEMTRTDHRGKGNYKKNHTNTGKTKSEIDREKFDKQREQHWKKEWDKGRFDNLPDPK